MNAKQVLSKVVKLLNLEAEVELTYAKLADGTIVESKTFDVGEELFVVSEDGTKTPAPNGTHELMLKDEEGNETLLKVITEDGKIVERENVELKVEEIQTEKLPGDPTESNDVKDEKTAGEQVENLKPSSKLSEVQLEDTPMEETEEVDKIPADDDKEEMGMPEMLKKIEDMAYRIEEMEKKISKMGEMKEKMEEDKEEKEEMEEELPKLDGAPIEEGFKFSSEQNNKRFGKKTDTPQNSFLSKLYK